jgi:hypothetical protein
MTGWTFLPYEELKEALSAPPAARASLVIAARFAPLAGMVFAMSAEMKIVGRGVGWFAPQGKTRPDFDVARPTDYGNTLSLGKYEVESEHFLSD